MTSHPTLQSLPAPRLSRDFSWWIWTGLVLAALAWTMDLYRPERIRFPKEASEFRTPEELETDLNVIQTGLEQNPHDMNLWIRLMIARYEQGANHHLEAVEALEKARDLGALDERLFFYAGVLYESLGLTDYARPDYARYLRHRPLDHETRLRFANLLYKTGALDDAVREYSRVRAEVPGDPVAAFNLAMAHRDRQEWKEGLELLDGLLKQGRGLPEGGARLLGDLHFGAGQYREALDDYINALARNKDDEVLMEALAFTYEQMGEWPESLAQWKRLLEKNPRNRRAQNKIRSIRKEMKKNERR